MPHSTLAEWMQDRRLHKKRLNDADVAAQTGISRSQISRIRTGASTPSRDNALKLEEITKIPAARFLLGLAAKPKEGEGAAA